MSGGGSPILADSNVLTFDWPEARCGSNGITPRKIHELLVQNVNSSFL